METQKNSICESLLIPKKSLKDLCFSETWKRDDWSLIFSVMWNFLWSRLSSIEVKQSFEYHMKLTLCTKIVNRMWILIWISERFCKITLYFQQNMNILCLCLRQKQITPKLFHKFVGTVSLTRFTFIPYQYKYA